MNSYAEWATVALHVDSRTEQILYGLQIVIPGLPVVYVSLYVCKRTHGMGEFPSVGQRFLKNIIPKVEVFSQL